MSTHARPWSDHCMILRWPHDLLTTLGGIHVAAKAQRQKARKVQIANGFGHGDEALVGEIVVVGTQILDRRWAEIAIASRISTRASSFTVQATL